MGIFYSASEIHTYAERNQWINNPENITEEGDLEHEALDNGMSDGDIHILP